MSNEIYAHFTVDSDSAIIWVRFRLPGETEWIWFENTELKRANNIPLGRDRLFANTMRDALSRAVSEKIEAERRKAYEKGWDDHRKRHRKKTGFSDCFNTESGRGIW